MKNANFMNCKESLLALDRVTSRLFFELTSTQKMILLTAFSHVREMLIVPNLERQLFAYFDSHFNSSKVRNFVLI